MTRSVGCILWSNTNSAGVSNLDAQFRLEGTAVVALGYSLVQEFGVIASDPTMLDEDPLFMDPDGEDNTPGTEDDNLSLQQGSPARGAAEGDPDMGSD